MPWRAPPRRSRAPDDATSGTGAGELTVAVGAGDRTATEFAYVLAPVPGQRRWIVSFRDVTLSRLRERRLAAIAKAASSVASKRSLVGTLEVLAREVARTDALAGVQVLTVNSSGDRLHVMGAAGFGRAADFFDKLMECRALGARLMMLEALETRRAAGRGRAGTRPCMRDPAWAPAARAHAHPRWDWFVSVPLLARGEPVGILNAFFAPGPDRRRHGAGFPARHGRAGGDGRRPCRAAGAGTRRRPPRGAAEAGPRPARLGRAAGLLDDDAGPVPGRARRARAAADPREGGPGGRRPEQQRRGRPGRPARHGGGAAAGDRHRRRTRLGAAVPGGHHRAPGRGVERVARHRRSRRRAARARRRPARGRLPHRRGGAAQQRQARRRVEDLRPARCDLPRPPAAARRRGHRRRSRADCRDRRGPAAPRRAAWG